MYEYKCRYFGVHAYQLYRETFGEELDFDIYGLGYDLVDSFLRELELDMRVEKTSEVCVHAFVARDELVAESESGHELPLFEPEDRTEAAGEEDAFHGREGHQSLGERVVVVDPADRPLSLYIYHLHQLHRVQKE